VRDDVFSSVDQSSFQTEGSGVGSSSSNSSSNAFSSAAAIRSASVQPAATVAEVATATAAALLLHSSSSSSSVIDAKLGSNGDMPFGCGHGLSDQFAAELERTLGGFVDFTFDLPLADVPCFKALIASTGDDDDIRLVSVDSSSRTTTTTTTSGSFSSSTPAKDALRIHGGSRDAWCPQV